MRTPERIAAAAIALMAAPALLALPALGAWYVHGVWGDLDGVDRGLFLSSLAMLCWTAPHVFRGRFNLFFHGRTGEFSLLDHMLIVGPIAVGTWAVARSWGALTPVAMCVAVVLFIRFNDWLKGVDGSNRGTTPILPTDAVEVRDRPAWRDRRAERPKSGGGVTYGSEARRRSSKHGTR